jgi:hypothetical protein
MQLSRALTGKNSGVVTKICRDGTASGDPFKSEPIMSIGLILIIILVIALAGGFTGMGGGRFYGTGYYGGGGLTIVLIILMFLFLSGRL